MGKSRKGKNEKLTLVVEHESEYVGTLVRSESDDVIISSAFDDLLQRLQVHSERPAVSISSVAVAQSSTSRQRIVREKAVEGKGRERE